jgi:hypothetical protein
MPRKKEYKVLQTLDFVITVKANDEDEAWELAMSNHPLSIKTGDWYEVNSSTQVSRVGKNGELIREAV